MSLIVLSKNNFLNIAISNIYEESFYNESNVCVIDLESFGSLREIFYELQRNKLSNDSSILLLGDRCLCSRMLSPLKVMSLSSPVKTIKLNIFRGCSLDELLNLITLNLTLKRLTIRELVVANVLRTENSIKHAALKKSLNSKDIYNKAALAAVKLNLRSIKDFRFFLNKEFSSDCINQIIRRRNKMVNHHFSESPARNLIAD